MEHWIWWCLNSHFQKDRTANTPEYFLLNSAMEDIQSLKANIVSLQNTARSTQRSVVCRLIGMKLTLLPHLSPDLIKTPPPPTQNFARKKKKRKPQQKQRWYMIICLVLKFCLFHILWEDSIENFEDIQPIIKTH